MRSSTVSVLFLWTPARRLQEYIQSTLSDRRDIDLIFPDSGTDPMILRRAPDADIVVGWRPGTELLNRASRVRLFINPGAGVQHLIEPFRSLAEKRDIILVNGHGNSYFTAQHAVALLLALTNRIIDHHTWMRNGRWRTGDTEAPSIPLRDRHIGLLGYGAVNKTVHRMLSGFDVGFSILKRHTPGSRHHAGNICNTFTPAYLNDFLECIDVLITAVPLTTETRGLIAADELKLLGPSGLLVNLSRGPVIDEHALFDALSQRTIAGAAIDVWYDYSPEPDARGFKFPAMRPFHTLPNVVLSPHRAASPFDDLRRWDDVIENIRRFADDREDLLNRVDLERGY